MRNVICVHQVGEVQQSKVPFESAKIPTAQQHSSFLVKKQVAARFRQRSLLDAFTWGFKSSKTSPSALIKSTEPLVPCCVPWFVEHLRTAAESDVSVWCNQVEHSSYSTKSPKSSLSQGAMVFIDSDDCSVWQKR